MSDAVVYHGVTELASEAHLTDTRESIDLIHTPSNATQDTNTVVDVSGAEGVSVACNTAARIAVNLVNAGAIVETRCGSKLAFVDVYLTEIPRESS